MKKTLVSSDSLDRFPHNRLTLTFSEGDWEGVPLCFCQDDSGLTVDIVPLVGFLSEGQTKWIYLTQDELNDRGAPLPADIVDNGIRIIAPSDEKVEQLVRSLSERGISFRKKGELLPPTTDKGDIEVSVHGQIDDVIRRCMAKIVFNYLAFTIGHDFALNENFNVVRKYVREGIAPDYPLVAVSNDPILHLDTQKLRQTDGHLVTVNWTPDNRHIVGQISLFNQNTYWVSLARDFEGLWISVRKGHLFDFRSNTISELGATSLLLPKS